MKKAGKYILLFLTVACLAYIFSNSLKNSSSSSAQSGRIVQLVSELCEVLTGKPVHPDRITHFVRKLAHFTEFALLGFLGTSAMASFFGKVRGRVHVLLFWGLASAVTDEFLQRFSRGRSPQVTDITLDFAGFLLGLGVAWLISALVARKRRKYELGVSVS